MNVECVFCGDQTGPFAWRARSFVCENCLTSETATVAVLAGAASYDDLSEREQALVRKLWAVRMEAARLSLNLAAEFAAAGESWSDADETGVVSRRVSEAFLAVLEFGELLPQRDPDPLVNLGLIWAASRACVEREAEADADTAAGRGTVYLTDAAFLDSLGDDESEAES